MKLVKIDEAKGGMKVAKDVEDQKGILLFKSGIVLTDDLIKRLKDRMISFVYIEEDGSAAVGLSEEDIKKKHEELEANLTRMFSDVISNPIMVSLYESAKKYLKTKV